MTNPPDEPRADTPAAAGDEAARLFGLGLEPASGAARVPPLPPEHVQPWFPDLEILEVLGQGGMGVVYKARQRALDRLVALKVLPESFSNDPAFAERFTREARTLARLRHPHIVGVHEFGQTDGHHYLTMEYVDGVTLRQLMDTRSLTPKEALAFVPQICDALQYAHDQGVVHRDIKPENVLLDRAGQVKVADFGLAKLVQRIPGELALTGTGQVMGTLQYMAPEQYKRPQEVDHRADIFSLGVVFYEMLTGELPIGRFAKPSESASLDTRIDRIVLRALERERDLRFQQARDMQTAVSDVTSNKPHSAFFRNVARHGDPGRPWSRVAVAAAVSVPAALLLGVLVFFAVEELAPRPSDGAWKAFYATVAGFWTTLGGLGLAALLGLIGTVVTARHPETVRGHLLAVGSVVVALILIPLTIEIGNEEIGSVAHFRNLEAEGLFPDNTQVEGARTFQSAQAIRRDVSSLWNEYVRGMRSHDLGIADVQPLYARDDLETLRMMFAEIDARPYAFGMGLVGRAEIVVPPWELLLTRIEVDEWEREAVVTVTFDSRGARRWVIGQSRSYLEDIGRVEIRFPMRRDEGRWVFAVGDVTVERSGVEFKEGG